MRPDIPRGRQWLQQAADAGLPEAERALRMVDEMIGNDALLQGAPQPPGAR